MRRFLGNAGVMLTSLGLVSCPLIDLQGASPSPAGPQAVAVARSPAAVQPHPVAAPSASVAAHRAEADAWGSGAVGRWPDPSQAELEALRQQSRFAQRRSAPHPQLSGAGSRVGPQAPIDPELALASIARETLVFAEPSRKSPKLGYLRAGAVVRRAPAPSSRHGCAAGWYRLEPEGYVCVGQTATLDAHHPIVRALRRRPDRDAPLPYPYARSRIPASPFYTKVPTEHEQRRVEPDLVRHLRATPQGAWDLVPFEPVPEFLGDGKPAYSLNGYVHSRASLYTGRALPDSGFALLTFFQAQGRKFGLSADLAIMPLDRLKPVRVSDFRGLPLTRTVALPVVFVRSRRALLYRRSSEGSGGALRVDRKLGYREAVPITGRRQRIGGVWYLETRDGGWLRDERLVRVDRPSAPPSWATPGRTWLDVSVLKQVLVAYEGVAPVYVTLVSTGADGLGDPERTHSTVRGRFLIHTKHVTATMSGDEVGDEFDLRDVPYVQYFTQGYALHAAYWHDDFGRPRSHGCINLSPYDAKWLFQWTDPPVPDHWHGAMSLRDGTLVNIHP